LHIDRGTHACLIYTDEDSRRGAIAEFLADALRRTGRVRYFQTGGAEEWLPAALARLGVPAAALPHGHAAAEPAVAEPSLPEAPAPGDTAPFVCSDAEAVYVPDGRFRAAPMLRRLTEVYDRLACGCDGPIHVAGEMGWALHRDSEETGELLHYEAEVNRVVAERPFSAVCQYDASAFAVDFLYEILRVHPFLIIDGTVVQNAQFDARAHLDPVPTVTPRPS
jgi:hypothetical protein